MFGRNFNFLDADYPLVPDTPLASGANTHLTDAETLLPMPYIIPAGYTLTLISASGTGNEDTFMYSYLDNGLYVIAEATVGGGGVYYFNKIVGLSTTWLGPAALLVPHVIDIKVYNRGGGDLYGGVMLNAILERVGTAPWPTTKECRCPFCGHRQVVPVHTTKIKCGACGKEYGVFDLTQLRGIG
ncbi:hypothetical protein ES703_101869 [subsurface metagenome]